MNKPNVIFYFSDQQRYDTVCEEVTPNLMQLASQGTNFNNAFTCQPVCGPARACLQTGLYASKNGCYRNDIKLKDDAITIAQLLNDSGYDTAYIGKWHLASNGVSQNYRTIPTPIDRRGGYRYWRAVDCLEFTSDGYGGYVYDNDGNKCTFHGNRADSINEYLLDYIRNGRDKNKPFFSFISQLEPHHQNSTDKYECPHELKGKFDKMPIPEDIAFLSGNYSSRYGDYLACCNSLDYNVGKLIECLKEEQLWDNTVLIYASDHGCHFRTRNMEYKRSCHDASTHIPLIICGGAFKGGLQIDELISLIDLPPTILDICGVNIPKTFDGVSLIHSLDGPIREYVYIEISESQLGRAIRTRDYIYSMRKPRSLGVESADAKVYRDDKLYDLNIDPHQQKNLIFDPKYNAIKRNLQGIIAKELKERFNQTPKIKRKLTSWHTQP